MSAKIIVDSAVLVSAYAIDGEIRRYWRALLADYTIVISPEIFIEVESRLRNGEFGLSSEEIKSALQEIVKQCQIVRPSPAADAPSEPIDASNFATLARHRFPDGVSPTYLITADDRLTRETAIDGCKILRIEDFCSSLRQLQTI